MKPAQFVHYRPVTPRCCVRRAFCICAKTLATSTPTRWPRASVISCGRPCPTRRSFDSWQKTSCANRPSCARRWSACSRIRAPRRSNRILRPRGCGLISLARCRRRRAVRFVFITTAEWSRCSPSRPRHFLRTCSRATNGFPPSFIPITLSLTPTSPAGCTVATTCPANA